MSFSRSRAPIVSDRSRVLAEIDTRQSDFVAKNYKTVSETLKNDMESKYVDYLLLLIILPTLIRQTMMADTETILNVFGKNEQFRKVFRAVFIALAGPLLAQITDPATAQEILRR